MIVRLTKLKEAENPLHPNNIETGYVLEGKLMRLPKVGDSFCMWRDSSGWNTSEIQEIIDDNTFRTLNSIYKWEILDVTEEEIQFAKKVLEFSGVKNTIS